MMYDGIQHLLGMDDPSGHWYNFWSGFGADIGELAILGAVVGTYRKHNCHIKGCWRISKQDIEGTTWKVCHRHHPHGRPTTDDVAAHHERLMATKTAQADVLHAQARRARQTVAEAEAHPFPVEIVEDRTRTGAGSSDGDQHAGDEHDSHHHDGDRPGSD